MIWFLLWIIHKYAIFLHPAHYYRNRSVPIISVAIVKRLTQTVFFKRFFCFCHICAISHHILYRSTHIPFFQESFQFTKFLAQTKGIGLKDTRSNNIWPEWFSFLLVFFSCYDCLILHKRNTKEKYHCSMCNLCFLKEGVRVSDINEVWNLDPFHR